eukprot:Lithocolla_globosa_v1_NODE_1175_length_2811_cov_32.185776.p1 type:complete len:260 gc:universal NODE_1175_length_2811_cov_32.185776:164-943(+)
MSGKSSLKETPETSSSQPSNYVAEETSVTSSSQPSNYEEEEEEEEEEEDRYVFCKLHATVRSNLNDNVIDWRMRVHRTLTFVEFSEEVREYIFSHHPLRSHEMIELTTIIGRYANNSEWYTIDVLAGFEDDFDCYGWLGQNLSVEVNAVVGRVFHLTLAHDEFSKAHYLQTTDQGTLTGNIFKILRNFWGSYQITGFLYNEFSGGLECHGDWNCSNEESRWVWSENTHPWTTADFRHVYAIMNGFQAVLPSSKPPKSLH